MTLTSIFILPIYLLSHFIINLIYKCIHLKVNLLSKELRFMHHLQQRLSNTCSKSSVKVCSMLN